MNGPKSIFVVFLFFVLSGCILGEKKLVVNINDPSSFSSLNTTITSVNIQNNQLIVNGTGLSTIKTIKLKNNSIDETFNVESAGASQLIANGIRNLSIGIGQVFDLVLSDAVGSAVYQVTFTMGTKSVTAPMLDTMGAQDGYVLKYDGINNVWITAPLASSQNYIGTWDANTDTPNLAGTSPLSGDYYIVSVAGTYNAVNYELGDWIIYDGTIWSRVASSAATKLSLSGGELTGDLVLDTILKLKGASNYVTLKASSSLAADIVFTLPLTTGTNGQVLTTDGAGVMSWSTISSSATPSGSAGGDLSGSYPNPTIASLAATKIADGSVSSAEFQYLSGVTSNIQTQLNSKQVAISAGTADQVLRIPSGGGAAVFGAIDLTKSAAVTGALSFSNGGTGANLTAVNGGVAYSNATTLGLTAAGVSGQFLKSAGAAAPAFSSILISDLKSSVAGNLFPGSACTTSQTLLYSAVTDSFSCAGISAGSSFSALTAAAGTNTIDNLNFGQNWNWSTATTQTAITMAANSLTTGSLLDVSTSNASVNSTKGLISVANTSASASGFLARFQSNSTAGSGMTILNSGYVGIGTVAPGYQLDLTGSVRAVGFYYSSDRRLKKDIHPLLNPVEKIKALEGVSFKWKKTGIPTMGFIAQDVEKVIPEVVKTDKVSSYKSVEYGNIVALIVEGLKHFMRDVESKFSQVDRNISSIQEENIVMKKQLQIQQEQIDQLTERLEKLEK